jgi:hypothetical protein
MYEQRLTRGPLQPIVVIGAAKAQGKVPSCGNAPEKPTRNWS